MRPDIGEPRFRPPAVLHHRLDQGLARLNVILDRQRLL
jgi:hypothetical protein